MTQILQNTFNKLSKLSVQEQNAIALLIEEELEWENKFKNSQETLTQLAKEARAEYKRGETKPWDMK